MKTKKHAPNQHGAVSNEQRAATSDHAAFAPTPAAPSAAETPAGAGARARAAERRRPFRRETRDGADGLAEELAEAYVENATGADDAATEHRGAYLVEDDGGPFVITTGATEFADGTDASNPPDAECEAFPTVSPTERSGR